MLLGVELLFLRQPMLAATGGALHAIGKYGSVVALRLPKWSSLCRAAVVVSRIPAIVATLLAVTLVVDDHPIWSIELLTPVTMLVCYGLWLLADLLLRPAKAG